MNDSKSSIIFLSWETISSSKPTKKKSIISNRFISMNTIKTNSLLQYYAGFPIIWYQCIDDIVVVFVGGSHWQSKWGHLYFRQIFFLVISCLFSKYNFRFRLFEQRKKLISFYLPVRSWHLNYLYNEVYFFNARSTRNVCAPHFFRD